MNTQRSLSNEEQRELAALNAAVTDAIATRREWLDAKMHETSRLHPGDDIYDVRGGQRLGTIRRLYRYSADQHAGVWDTSVSCDYEYETRPRSVDNTSRQIGLWFGTRADAARHADIRASELSG
jgi:hypothetical protein